MVAYTFERQQEGFASMSLDTMETSWTFDLFPSGDGMPKTPLFEDGFE